MLDQSAATSTALVARPAGPRSQRLRATLELLKPITWFAPMWALACGAVSAGVPFAANWWRILGAVFLAGPMVCGTSQAVNDWYDREVDAINQPERPIPSGRLPGSLGFEIAFALTLISFVFSSLLGPAVIGAALFGLALAWAYSAPPFRLKLNGWLGNAAVGLCYEGLPWFTGTAALIGHRPDWRIVVFAVAYSVGAFGIMVLNDFKSIAGDAALGVRTLPVQLGVRRAAILACVVMAVPQAFVVGFLIYLGRPLQGRIVGALLLVQVLLMPVLVRHPKKRAPLYNATGTTGFVAGMMVSAFALRALALGN